MRNEQLKSGVESLLAHARQTAKNDLSGMEYREYNLNCAMQIRIEEILNGLPNDVREKLPTSIDIKKIDENDRSFDMIVEKVVKFDLRTLDPYQVKRTATKVKDSQLGQLNEKEQTEEVTQTKFSSRERLELWPDIIDVLDKVIKGQGATVPPSPIPQKT